MSRIISGKNGLASASAILITAIITVSVIGGVLAWLNIASETNEYETGFASVNDIEILILESFPVQVRVIARGELPDSCTKVDEITTRREGNTFFVTITTSRPVGALCAQVITPFEEVIALDVIGLKAGIYTVDVNEVRDTFELQVDNIL